MALSFAFKKLNTRLALLFILLVLVPLGFFGLVAYQSASQSLEAELGRRLTTVASMTAFELRGEDLAGLVAGGRAVRRLREKVANLAALSRTQAVMVFAPDQTVLVDSRGRLGLGDSYLFLKLDLAEWKEARAGRPVSSPLFRGLDGRLYKSAYAPVLDSKGRFQGMVRVEASAEFLSVLRQFGLTLLLFGVASLALALSLAAVVSRPMVRPLNGLVKAARRGSQGDFSARVRADRRDEIGLLAGTFNEMARQVGDFVRSREHLASLGELSAGVAHEIRNPLAAIEGFAGLLARKLPARDPRREHAQDILDEVRVLNQFLTDFLDYARPAPPRLEEVPLKEALASAWALAFPKGLARRFRLKAQGLEGAVARADPGQLKRVLINLLANAREAMPKGGPVRVGAARVDGSWRLWVQDQGRGIAPADMLKLFTPFHTTKPMGTGLGLAIADKIMKAMGGGIEAESQPGRGAKFILRFPVETGPLSEEKPWP